MVELKNQIVMNNECSGGTKIFECSIEKIPKYCDKNRNLIDNCQSCGCSANLVCQEDGSCM